MRCPYQSFRPEGIPLAMKWFMSRIDERRLGIACFDKHRRRGRRAAALPRKT
jgi:hypothetical protein